METQIQLEESQYFELTRHEDQVINHRLTWLLAGQPLLFLAYVNAASVPIPANRQLQPAHLAILKSIPFVGFAMAFAVFLGVLGAVLALFVLRTRRKSYRFAGITGCSTILGLVPPVLIPLALMWAWFCLPQTFPG